MKPNPPVLFLKGSSPVSAWEAVGAACARAKVFRVYIIIKGRNKKGDRFISKEGQVDKVSI